MDAGDRSRPARPLLVAALIVRDEEAMLPGCLASLEGLVDRLEICDTGSVDATVAIAHAAGAGVIERTWRDDFAWARNEVLARCTDAWWVLQVDADERVVCAAPTELRRELADAAGRELGFAIPITNVDEAGRERSTFTAVRLFRGDQVRYEDALHERVVALPGVAPRPWAALDTVALRHLGYVREQVAGRDKYARNLAIARRAYEADPSAQQAVNYARALAAAGAEPARQRALLEQALAEGADIPDGGRASLLALLAARVLDDGDAARAAALAEEALALVPADDTAARVHGHAAGRLGRHDEVLAMAAWRRTAHSPPQALESPREACRARSREVAALAALGKVDEAHARALEILAAEPAGFDAWAELAAGLLAACPRSAVERLAEAARADAEDACMPALARALRPEQTADLAARLCTAGAASSETVKVGVLAALVAGRGDLAEAIADHAAALDPAIVEDIAERAEQRGHARVAERLRAPFVPS